jgi:carbon-monoxide dehydrogenase medium subunit
MKSAAFEFIGCQSVSQALTALEAADGTGKICSGTQSLGPMLNLRLFQTAQLIDVSQIEALKGFVLDPKMLQIGAAVTHARIEDGELPDVTKGLLPRVAGGIAYRAVRNRGTLGGSLAHADPAADWVSTMCLLNATLMLRSPDGERSVQATAFFEGAFTTQLQSNELLVAVRIPRFGSQARWAYQKFCRKPGEFAQALACLWVDPLVGIARLVLRGLDRMPYVVQTLDTLNALRNPQALDRTFDEMGLDDTYERQILRVMVRRAFNDLDTFPV